MARKSKGCSVSGLSCERKGPGIFDLHVSDHPLEVTIMGGPGSGKKVTLKPGNSQQLEGLGHSTFSLNYRHTDVPDCKGHSHAVPVK